MKIPNWILRYIDSAGLSSIEQAVKAAEAKTSGEIVPIVVRRSSAIGRVHCELMQVLFILVVFAYAWCATYVPTVANGLLAACCIVVVPLSFWLARRDLVQRMFTNSADRERQVNIRAEVEFFEAKLNRTKAKTGILLFCSLMERRAVVLADKAISEKLSQETWSEVVNLIISGIKQGNLANGYVNAIARCGEILATHFPIAPDDENELSDGLIIKLD